MSNKQYKYLIILGVIIIGGFFLNYNLRYIITSITILLIIYILALTNSNRDNFPPEFQEVSTGTEIYIKRWEITKNKELVSLINLNNSELLNNLEFLLIDKDELNLIESLEKFEKKYSNENILKSINIKSHKGIIFLTLKYTNKEEDTNKIILKNSPLNSILYNTRTNHFIKYLNIFNKNDFGPKITISIDQLGKLMIGVCNETNTLCLEDEKDIKSKCFILGEINLLDEYSENIKNKYTRASKLEINQKIKTQEKYLKKIKYKDIKSIGNKFSLELKHDIGFNKFDAFGYKQTGDVKNYSFYENNFFYISTIRENEL